MLILLLLFLSVHTSMRIQLRKSSLEHGPLCHERAIEQIKTLGEIISGFLKRISNSPTCEAGGTSIDDISDRLAVDIAAVFAGRFPGHEGVSIEEFLKAAVRGEPVRKTAEPSDEDESSSTEKTQRDLGVPTPTWVRNVMSTLPMSELQRLLREVIPGLCKSVEISTEAGQGAHADKGRRADMIRDCTNNELIRRREYRAYVVTILTTEKSKEDLGKRGSSLEQALCKRLFEARPVKEDIDGFLYWWSSCLYVDDSSGVEQKKIITTAIKSGNADEIVRDEVIRELERIPGKRLGFKIMSGRKTEAEAKRPPPPLYDSLMAGCNIPYDSEHPKTRHPRDPGEAFIAVDHMDHVLSRPWKDFPFPAGKLKEEFDQYADKDLARLVDNLCRACYVLESITSEPLSQELLHYYVYVPLPCQSRVLSLCQGDDARLPPAKGPMNRKWKYAREKITENRKYESEPIMNLILTDMTYRNPKLAEQVERLCEAVVHEAIETDEYFGRLVELTPDYWNEREYEPRIKKFKACLRRLWGKLNHMGQLLENELKGRGLTETEQKIKSGKKSNKKTTKANKAEKKFKPWNNPGDACFILDGNRILFHYNEMLKDLSLISHGKTQNLLVMLYGRTLQSCDVKSKLCSPGTKPIQLVIRANQQLNDKIRKLGFTGLPEYDIEFIRYNSRFDHYESALPIHACRADFDDAEIRMMSRG